MKRKEGTLVCFLVATTCKHQGYFYTAGILLRFGCYRRLCYPYGGGIASTTCIVRDWNCNEWNTNGIECTTTTTTTTTILEKNTRLFLFSTSRTIFSSWSSNNTIINNYHDNDGRVWMKRLVVGSAPCQWSDGHPKNQNSWQIARTRWPSLGRKVFDSEARTHPIRFLVRYVVNQVESGDFFVKGYEGKRRRKLMFAV